MTLQTYLASLAHTEDCSTQLPSGSGLSYDDMHSELVLSQAHTDNDNTMLLPSESLVHCGGITTAEVEASQATQPSPGPSWEHSYSSHTQLSRDSFNSGLIQLCQITLILRATECYNLLYVPEMLRSRKATE